MTTSFSSALWFMLSLGLLACGDSTGSGASGGGGASAGGAPATGGEASTGGTPSTGGTGEGGQGTGGATGEASVSMTVDPTTVAAGDDITATVTVENFVLEAPGGANQEGHGHYHIYLDDASGGQYLIADQEPTTTFTIPANTAAGAHTLRVSVSDNSHVPLSPAVEDVVDITVE